MGDRDAGAGGFVRCGAGALARVPVVFCIVYASLVEQTWGPRGRAFILDRK
jgi:hypothetical protein